METIQKEWQITMILSINLNFLGKNLKILFTNNESIVTLYPEALRYGLPPILVASSNSLLNNLFCPKMIPANRED